VEKMVIRTILSRILYYLGDIASKLPSNKYTAEAYQWLMCKSVTLDIHYKVWKKAEKE